MRPKLIITTDGNQITGVHAASSTGIESHVIIDYSLISEGESPRVVEGMTLGFAELDDQDREALEADGYDLP